MYLNYFAGTTFTEDVLYRITAC